MASSLLADGMKKFIAIKLKYQLVHLFFAGYSYISFEIFLSKEKSGSEGM